MRVGECSWEAVSHELRISLFYKYLEVDIEDFLKNGAVSLSQLLVWNSGFSLCKLLVYFLPNLQFLFVLFLLYLLFLFQCSRTTFLSFLILLLSILLIFPSQFILFLLLHLLLSIKLLCHPLLLEVQGISILLEISWIYKRRVDDFYQFIRKLALWFFLKKCSNSVDDLCLCR